MNFDSQEFGQALVGCALGIGRDQRLLAAFAIAHLRGEGQGALVEAHFVRSFPGALNEVAQIG